MLQRWVDPNQRSAAMSELQTNNHQHWESIQDYNHKFDTLCGDADLNMDPIAPTTVSMYLNGLQSDLRTAMLSSKPQEVIEQMKWEEIMKLSQDQSNALHKYQAKRQKTTSSTQSQNTRGNGQQQHQQGKGGGGKHGNGKGKGKNGK